MAGVAKVHIVPDPRAHPKELAAPPALWEQLEVRPGRWVTLQAGQKGIPMRVCVGEPINSSSASSPTTLQLHPAVLHQLGIPSDGLRAHLRTDGTPENPVLRIGPFVAILGVRGRGSAPFGGHELYFRTLAAFSRSLGIPAYVFSSRDVDWNRGVVRGFQWGRGGRGRGWRRSEFPLPDVVYDRLLSRRAEAQPSVQSLRRRLEQLPGLHYFNPGYFDKWDLHQRMMERPELDAYLPATRRLESNEVLRDFLRRYRTVFIKPSGGSLGLGIAVVRRSGRGYSLTHYTRAGTLRRRFAGFQGLAAHLKAYTGHRDYIVQQGIPLARWGNRRFDIRVIMQKDAGGRWCRTKSYVRLAPPGSMTSNLSGGGTARRIAPILGAAFGPVRGQRLTREVHSLAATLTPLIEEQIDGTIGELGLDLGIDRRGRFWIIEVNSKPYLQMTPGSGTPRAIRLSALRPLRWARSLAGFEPGDEAR